MPLISTNRPRLHVVSLPHTQLNGAYLSCAYSQKIVKFCKMMARKYDIFLYANDQSEVEGVFEHITLLTEEERSGYFGGGFDTVLGGKNGAPLIWSSAQPYWRLANLRAIAEIEKRKQKHDFLLIIAGDCQLPISHAHPELTCVEWGVGYEGIATGFCAFESYAWMHHVYGLRRIINGRAFDTVIPNYFDPKDFEVESVTKKDYLLYIGRLVQRKGLEIAAEIAKYSGRQLIIAGPGATHSERGLLIYPEGKIEGDIEYVGEVGLKDRAKLMREAAATLVPTLYIEPFGGVAVESMMCGTPVVASDWGAFTETVQPQGGARFRSLREGVLAVRDVVTRCLPADVQAYAEAHYSLDAVYPKFDHWFESLLTLWRTGWYDLEGVQASPPRSGAIRRVIAPVATPPEPEAVELLPASPAPSPPVTESSPTIETAP